MSKESPFGTPTAIGVEALRGMALASSNLVLHWVTLVDLDPTKRCLHIAKTLAAEARKNGDLAHRVETTQMMQLLKDEALARAGASASATSTGPTRSENSSAHHAP